MSKSWIVMSRKIPPETRTYASGGGAGSRLVMRTRCGSPTRPVATAARTEAWAGSKRRLKPIWNGTPAASTASSARSTVSRSSETGFSQKIALPARAASTMRSACVSVLVQIATASTSGAASISATDPATGTPRSAPMAVALSARASKTAASVADGIRRASRSACMRPMRPTPMTPMRTGGVSAVAVEGRASRVLTSIVTPPAATRRPPTGPTPPSAAAPPGR